jgi:hypothetical protein
MGGLTISGFVLPPRKSVLVSLAGPLVGIPVAIAVMVLRPWLPAGDPIGVTAGDLIFVNLWWGILNLLPIAGLDGGSIATNLFVLAMDQRGRTPGQAVVGLCSVAIAIGAVLIGFVYLAVVIVFFGFFNPEPYLALWRIAGGGTRGPRVSGVPWPRPQPRAETRTDRKGGDGRGRERSVAMAAAESRRAFGEAYAETLPDDVGEASALDLDELERRPGPLLPDVIGMVSRRDDPAVASRLATETDPLAVLGIVARIVESGRVPQLLVTLRREETGDRTVALLKLQVGLHSLGRFEDSLAAASILGRAGGARSAVLEARSAARTGDRKRTAAALERAVELGPIRLSDGALGDIARLGPDKQVAEALARLRSSFSVN